MITSFLKKDHKDWDKNLTEFRFAINTAYHSSTKSTPAFLNCGRVSNSVNSIRKREENHKEVELQPRVS